MDASDLISAIQGMARADLPPDVKLATVDPAYTVGTVADPTLPKVTFDGETTMSTKQYPIVSGYVPTASDRVVLVPVGRTYVIIGTVSHPRPLRTGARGVLTGSSQTLIASSASWAAASADTDMTVTVTADAARLYRVHYLAAWNLNGPGVWHIFLKDNGTQVARMAIINSDGTILDGIDSSAFLWAPTTGSHTLLIRANNFTGISTLFLYGAADTPRQLWVEDVGPR